MGNDLSKTPAAGGPQLSRPPLLLQGDLGKASLGAALTSKQLLLPWDTETSGLDWQKEKLEIVQIAIDGAPVIVQNLDSRPGNLIALLENPEVRKVFHYAMFDLRFMAYTWGAHPQNIICTKIMSKLLDPSEGAKHSLGPLLEENFGVILDKDPSVRVSNWGSPDLTPRQLTYAANDVLYLPALAEKQMAELHAQELDGLAERCFAHLPERVALELEGKEDDFTFPVYGDVFTY